MGAAVVQREDVTALVHEKDRAMAAVHNESPFGFYLFEGARAHEVRDLSIHLRLIRQAVRGDTIQRGPSSNVNPASNLPFDPTAYVTWRAPLWPPSVSHNLPSRAALLGYLSCNLSRRLSAFLSILDLGKRFSHSAQNPIFPYQRAW